MLDTGSSENLLASQDPLKELGELRMKLLENGEQVIDLSMINPDIPPPRYLIDRLIESSIKPHLHRYSVSRGVRRLRSAFANKYLNRFHVELDPEKEVCVTMGTKDALFNILLCCAERGDRVLVGRPVYPTFLSAMSFAGLSWDYFDISENEDSMIAELKASLSTGRFKVLLLNFPNNPTGISVSREFYLKLVEILRQIPCVVINDFAYGEMGFSKTPISLLAAGLKDKALETYSISKAYGVAGWRVGAVLGSSIYVQRLAKLKSHLDFGIFLPIQFAAASGLNSSKDLVGPIVESYSLRADLLSKGLTELGWEVSKPTAGACVWARLPKELRGFPATQFAYQLLRDYKILVLPGETFGEGFEEHIRFSLVVPPEEIVEVINRLSLIEKTTIKLSSASEIENDRGDLRV